MSTRAIHVLYDTPMLLGESPLWHPEEAALYWIDIAGLALHRHDPANGAHKQWSLPSEPGCIAWMHSHRMVIAMRHGLAVLDTLNGTLSSLTPPPYDPAGYRFNDGRCDAAGRLWTGSLVDSRAQASASLFCVERGAIRDAMRPVTVSNGVAFSPDNRTLYHTDTSAHRITAYDFDLASGALGDGRLLHQFNAAKDSHYGGRPDGAAVDSEGAYWCAMYEGGRILRLAPSGDILEDIPLPVRCPTMVAFGGDDLKTLYVTTVSNKRPPEELSRLPLSGCVLHLRVDIPGRPEPAYLD